MNEWWLDYFGDGWCKVGHYGHSEEDTVAEAAFIASELNTHNCNRVLDVPCAYGRMTIELAQLGFLMTGVDINAKVIETARQKSVTAEVDVNWVKDDMRSMSFETKFDAAICTLGSFGYFTDEGNFQFIHSVAKALKPGGCFLLETHTMETLLPVFAPKEYWQFEDAIILESREFNHHNSRMEGKWTIIKNGKQSHYSSSVRIYSFRELINILSDAGLDVVTTYSDYDGSPFEFGADNLLILAQKIDRP